MSRHNDDQYEQRFVSFSNKIEALLIRLLIALGVLILIAQFSLQFKGIRHWLVPVEKQEGEQIDWHSESTQDR